jgi:hypothetical protein
LVRSRSNATALYFPVRVLPILSCNSPMFQRWRIGYVFAVLRLMAPFMAIVRLLVASVYARATIAGIHAVAAITFALLMTVLYVGTIARPIGREYCCDPKHTTCDQNNRTPCCYDISHSFSFLVNACRQIRSSRKSGQDTSYLLRNLIFRRYRRF